MTDFSDPILGGEQLVRQAIRSQNYQVGTAGWRIARDGSVEFQDGIFRGDIQAATVDVVDTVSGASVKIDPVFWPDNVTPNIELDPNDNSNQSSPGRIHAAFDTIPLLTLRPPTRSDGGDSQITLFGENDAKDNDTLLRIERIGAWIAGTPAVKVGNGSAEVELHVDGDARFFRDATVSDNLLVFGTITTQNQIVVSDEGIACNLADTPVLVDDDLEVSGAVESSPMRPVTDESTTDIDILAMGGGSFNDDPGPSCSVVFTAPPSGMVTIMWQDRLELRQTALALREILSTAHVRAGGTPGSGSFVAGLSGDKAVRLGVDPGEPSSGAGGGTLGASSFLPLSGLTPGNTYNVILSYFISSASNVTSADSTARQIFVRPEM